MNIEHLKYLVTVADYGSIHEAARQLLLKQQYVSNVMKSLERYFDVQIFERHSKGVIPTTNGQYLIDKAREILTLFDDMEASYQYPDNQKQLDCGESITLYVPSYLDGEPLLDVLDEYNEHFPNSEITLVTGKLNETTHDLLYEPNSLFLFPTQNTIEQLEERSPSGLTYQKLESIPLRLFAAKTNPLAQKYTVIPIEKALTLNLAMLAPQSLERAPIYQALYSFGRPNVQYIVDNQMMLFRLLQKKNYFTIAKYDTLTENDTILSIPFSEPVSVSLFLIYHPDTLKSYAVRSLIQLMKKYQHNTPVL